MPSTLYSNPFSASARRVLLIASQLGLYANILAWLDRVQALPAWKHTQPAA